MKIRPAAGDDAPALSRLLTAYLAEQFPGHPGTSPEVLEREVLHDDSGQRVLLAVREEVPIGFIGWHRVYDLHWGKGGVQIADLYVSPDHRGHGIALALVAAVCAAGREVGARYLTGGAYDRSSPIGRFYERIAVAFDSAECHLAGAAFRHIAELHGRPPREMTAALPPKEWNFLP